MLCLRRQRDMDTRGVQMGSVPQTGFPQTPPTFFLKGRGLEGPPHTSVQAAALHTVEPGLRDADMLSAKSTGMPSSPSLPRGNRA